MPNFIRSFPVQKLAEWDADNPGNAIRALFDRWALPGEEATDATPLRLALRKRYVNFYAKGQSVARLSFAGGKPKLAVHQAYVNGQKRPREPNSLPKLIGYRNFDADSETAELIEGWRKTAVTYSSAEKRFVDDLVAANPGVIDLEMGLPASELPDTTRVAPRMDIVVAQLVNESVSIVFWEAKCANNTELRSKKDYAEGENGTFVGPKVINQVRKYEHWMAQEDRIDQIRCAYRDTAALLLDFYSTFRNQSKDTAPACLPIWRALAENEKPSIAVRPGVVIGNYWPENYTENIASGRMEQAAKSFAGAHRDKLINSNIYIHEVGKDPKTRSLPPILTGR